MKTRPLIINRDHALVPLSQGKFAVIDLRDVDEIGKYNWCLRDSGYASRNAYSTSKSTVIRMHRDINKTPKGLQTDHINGDKLDNRRSNLRTATSAQNGQNRRVTLGNSKYKGVTWDKNAKKWKAQIRKNGVQIYIGYFTAEQDAAKAYDQKALNIFGEYAYLNYIH